MDEHFQRHRRLVRHFLDVRDRQLPSQDDPLDAQLPAGKLDASWLGESHLRRSVDRQRRSDLSGEQRQAKILHDHGIGPGRRDCLETLGGGRQFVGENQRVEGNVPADIMPVQE